MFNKERKKEERNEGKGTELVRLYKFMWNRVVVLVHNTRPSQPPPHTPQD